MTESEIIQAVNEVFIDSFEIPPENIKPEAQIFVDLGLDSLDVVDLVAAIQKRFAVTVRDDERVRAIRTMQDLYTYLILIRAEQKDGVPPPATIAAPTPAKPADASSPEQ